MSSIETFLSNSGADPDLSVLLQAIAKSSLKVRSQLPFSSKLTRGVNTFGERQTEIDVLANDEFSSSLLATGCVAEVASEEMA